MTSCYADDAGWLFSLRLEPWASQKTVSCERLSIINCALCMIEMYTSTQTENRVETGVLLTPPSPSTGAFFRSWSPSFAALDRRSNFSVRFTITPNTLHRSRAEAEQECSDLCHRDDPRCQSCSHPLWIGNYKHPSCLALFHRSQDRQTTVEPSQALGKECPWHSRPPVPLFTAFPLNSSKVCTASDSVVLRLEPREVFLNHLRTEVRQNWASCTSLISSSFVAFSSLRMKFALYTSSRKLASGQFVVDNSVSQSAFLRNLRCSFQIRSWINFFTFTKGSLSTWLDTWAKSFATFIAKFSIETSSSSTVAWNFSTVAVLTKILIHPLNQPTPLLWSTA